MDWACDLYLIGEALALKEFDATILECEILSTFIQQ